MRPPYFVRKMRGSPLFEVRKWTHSDSTRSVLNTQGYDSRERAEADARRWNAHYFRREFHAVEGGLLFGFSRGPRPDLRLVGGAV